MAGVQPLKILSLDGGGVRGIATLYLLRGLMHQIALSTDQNPESLRPCDYFDLIAGTSTGGLIAIMLGRLRYTVEQAIEKYITLSEVIFSTPSSEADAKFDHRILESRIKQVITEAPCPRPRMLTADEALKDETFGLSSEQRIATGEPVAGCRTFVVCTITRGSGGRPEILRSYKTSHEFPFSGKIWEAARATFAAPTFFAPITVDHVTYGDGGTGWNNPTRLVISEVRQIWPNRPIGCLISLGTGEEDPNQLVTVDNVPKRGLQRRFLNITMPKKNFELEVAKYCAKCLTSCMRTHEDVLNNLERDQLVNSYFRLNTPGVGKVGLEEWKHIKDIISLTVDYLNAPDMKQMKIAIASRILSYHTLPVVMNIPARPELNNPYNPQQLPIRFPNSAEPQELSNEHRFQASASADSNTNFVPSSKPVAHLLSFAACCSFIVQRFDAMKHVDSSLRRLHVNVMGLSLSLRQLCFNILLQVPSSIKFKELSQIENLSDPDHEIPLLSLLQKDAQAHIDLFRILSELRKSLDDMGVEVDKLSGRIAEGTERDTLHIAALVKSYDFDSIQAKMKVSRSCLKQLSAKLGEHLIKKDKAPQSTFVKEPCASKSINSKPLTLDPGVVRCRLVRELSRDVFWALTKACGDHPCHSAQFQLRPHHVIELDSRKFVDFQIRFSGDVATLTPSDVNLQSAWLLIKSPSKNIRCFDKRRMHNIPNNRAFGTKRDLEEAFNQDEESERPQSKRFQKQPKREASQFAVDTQLSAAGKDAKPISSSFSLTKGIDFSARANFCNRILAYNQEHCTDPHRYLGFFRAGTNSEHRVFFSDAYHRLSQCQTMSLYDILRTIVPFPEKMSFPYERVELAKQLASAMLQFQNSPLLRHYWGGDDIVFFRQPETMGNVRSLFAAPYLNVQIKGCAQSSLREMDEDDDTPEDESSDSFVKNEYLFQLAKLLIEIAYQAEIEDLLSSQEAGLCDDDPELERWFVADRLCNDISSTLGSQYRAVVRLCLDASLKDDHLVKPDEYEDMISREVVNELEELKIAMVDELFG